MECAIWRENESVVISKDKLVTDAMRVNIEGICNALNKQINNGEVDGLLEKNPLKQRTIKIVRSNWLRYLIAINVIQILSDWRG